MHGSTDRGGGRGWLATRLEARHARFARAEPQQQARAYVLAVALVADLPAETWGGHGDGRAGTARLPPACWLMLTWRRRARRRPPRRQGRRGRPDPADRAGGAAQALHSHARRRACPHAATKCDCGISRDSRIQHKIMDGRQRGHVRRCPVLGCSRINVSGGMTTSVKDTLTNRLVSVSTVTESSKAIHARAVPPARGKAASSKCP